MPLTGDPRQSLHEAHNTLIDVPVISGIVGVAFLGFVVLRILAQGFVAGQLYPVLIMLGPVGLFSMFHYLGRQPLFWMTVWLAAQFAGSGASLGATTNAETNE